MGTDITLDLARMSSEKAWIHIIPFLVMGK